MRALKCAILVGLNFLSREDIALVAEKAAVLLHCESETSEGDEEPSSHSSSPVSVVIVDPYSEPSAQRNRPSLPVPRAGSAAAESSAGPGRCIHAYTTRKGSNHFQRRVKCKSCGVLLFKELTEAGHACKFDREKPRHG